MTTGMRLKPIMVELRGVEIWDEIETKEMRSELEMVELRLS